MNTQSKFEDTHNNLMNKRCHAFGDAVKFIIRDGFENLNATANREKLAR